MSRARQNPVTLLLFVVVLLTACGGSPSASGAGAGASATASGTTAGPVATATTMPGMPAATSEAKTTASSTSSVATAPVAAPAVPTATPVPVLPVKLEIPAIGVNATVEHVGLAPDGSMDVPAKWEDVGWYEYGPPPGQIGNSAIDGHLDSTTAPAVFWRLGSLKPGDQVIVTLSDASKVTFLVKEKVAYPYDKAPIDKVFGPATTANLNLITCGGTWDAKDKNYSDRIVVYATKAA